MAPPCQQYMQSVDFNLNMNMMNMNYHNSMRLQMNQDINKPWAESYAQKCYSNMKQSQDSISPGSSKINIVFKTNAKVKTNIVSDYGQTMSEVLLLYLKKKEKKICSKDIMVFSFDLIHKK